MKVMFIGAISAGKTTLIQRLNQEKIRYVKTQAVSYVSPMCASNHTGDSFIDTPGEYMQVRSFWCSLTTTSHDADMICLVQDSSSEDCWFSGGISSKFSKPVLGIVTKIDHPMSDPDRAEAYLKHAGCEKIFRVSALTDEGMSDLFEGMKELFHSYKEEIRIRCSDGYFD